MRERIRARRAHAQPDPDRRARAKRRKRRRTHRSRRTARTPDGWSSPTSTWPTPSPTSTGTSSSRHGGSKGVTPRSSTTPKRATRPARSSPTRRRCWHVSATSGCSRCKAAVGIFPARSEGDDIWITDPKGREHRLAMLRNQTRGAGKPLAGGLHRPQRRLDRLLRRDGGHRAEGAVRKVPRRGRRLQRPSWPSCWPTASPRPSPKPCTRSCGGRCGATKPAKRPLPGRSSAANTAAAAWPSATRPRPTIRSSARSSTCSRLELTTGMRLTENCMVDPGEALCGLLLADADYFSVGTVDTEQLLDYARRRGLDVETGQKTHTA